MDTAVKTKFSIKDLESLSGVKAHTIRIWEKRYHLFNPNRTDTNIRYYELADLQKLLNVTFLLQNGNKISKIAEHSTADIAQLVARIVAEKDIYSEDHAINSMKIAMMNFDQNLFYETYNTLIQRQTFSSIFYEVFLPILHQIGLLWQTDTINPSHEHFIYNLIKQKILLNIEELQRSVRPHQEKTFVLFLPENEIHELGLIFLNHEIVSQGYKVIYLGQSIQLESLRYISKNHPNVAFVSYFTVKPEVPELKKYFEEYLSLFEAQGHQLYLLGNQVKHIEEKNLHNLIRPMHSIREFTNLLKKESPSYA